VEISKTQIRFWGHVVHWGGLASFALSSSTEINRCHDLISNLIEALFYENGPILSFKSKMSAFDVKLCIRLWDCVIFVCTSLLFESIFFHWEFLLWLLWQLILKSAQKQSLPLLSAQTFNFTKFFVTEKASVSFWRNKIMASLSYFCSVHWVLLCSLLW